MFSDGLAHLIARMEIFRSLRPISVVYKIRYAFQPIRVTSPN